MDYISRDELRKHLADCMTAEFFDSDMKKAVVGIDVYVENMPAADVQPVKHGRWIPQGDDMWLCSNCKKNIIYSEHESDRTEKQRYCCKCGARMDLGDING